MSNNQKPARHAKPPSPVDHYRARRISRKTNPTATRHPPLETTGSAIAGVRLAPEVNIRRADHAPPGQAV